MPKPVRGSCLAALLFFNETLHSQTPEPTKGVKKAAGKGAAKKPYGKKK